MPGVSNDKAIKYGQMLDNEIKTNLFGHLECLVMEYEKTFNPYLQVTPKRYAGFKMEFDANEGAVSASGLQMVKRDSALLCKRTMQTFFKYLLIDKDKDKAYESVRLQLTDLFANNLPLEDYCITKKISKKASEYKTVPPHIYAWQRQVARDGEAASPSVGERFEFIVEKFGKKDDMSDFIVDSAIVRSNGFDKYNVDKGHYFRLFVFNPMHVITDLVYGKALSSKLMDPKQYEQVETITAKKGNILGFFKKDKLTSKRRFNAIDVDERFLNEVRQMRMTDFGVQEEQIGADEDQPSA